VNKKVVSQSQNTISPFEPSCLRIFVIGGLILDACSGQMAVTGTSRGSKMELWLYHVRFRKEEGSEKNKQDFSTPSDVTSITNEEN
jgi:hypothetical protein